MSSRIDHAIKGGLNALIGCTISDRISDGISVRNSEQSHAACKD
jgi:hypothetical protein